MFGLFCFLVSSLLVYIKLKKTNLFFFFSNCLYKIRKNVIDTFICKNSRYLCTILVNTDDVVIKRFIYKHVEIVYDFVTKQTKNKKINKQSYLAKTLIVNLSIIDPKVITSCKVTANRDRHNQQ